MKMSIVACSGGSVGANRRSTPSKRRFLNRCNSTVTACLRGTNHRPGARGTTPSRFSTLNYSIELVNGDFEVITSWCPSGPLSNGELPPAAGVSICLNRSKDFDHLSGLQKRARMPPQMRVYTSKCDSCTCGEVGTQVG